MPTYLLTWNPKKFNWEDLDSNYKEIRKKGYVDFNWSCQTKKIQKGDRVFLLCQGEEPRGILGSGQAISSVYEDESWDQEQVISGKKKFYVECRFDVLLDRNEILPRELLDRDRLKDMHWRTQASGISIPSPIAEELEKIWRMYLKHKNHISTFGTANKITMSIPRDEQEDFKIDEFIEGSIHTFTTYAYDRNPQARKVCIDHHGTNCYICNFNFKAVYGDIADGFIHVHHLKPLAASRKKHSVDPIVDLRPVCANCHAVIHLKKSPYTIDELKKKIVNIHQKFNH